MPQLRYLAYLAVVCAVLLDLYSAKPDANASIRLALDLGALFFAVVGLGGLAAGPARGRRL